MKYQWLLSVLLLFLTGCYIAPDGDQMTRKEFAEIDIGTPIEKITTVYGKPYAMYSKDNGSMIYEYNERMYLGSNMVEMRRYFLVVNSGKVIGKYVKISNPPPYERIYSDDPLPNY